MIAAIGNVITYTFHSVYGQILGPPYRQFVSAAPQLCMFVPSPSAERGAPRGQRFFIPSLLDYWVIVCISNWLSVDDVRDFIVCD